MVILYQLTLSCGGNEPDNGLSPMRLWNSSSRQKSFSVMPHCITDFLLFASRYNNARFEVLWKLWRIMSPMMWWMLCSVVDHYQFFGVSCCYHYLSTRDCTEDGGNRYLQNAGCDLPEYIPLHSRINRLGRIWFWNLVSLTQREDHGLRTLLVMIKIFGRRSEKVTGEWTNCMRNFRICAPKHSLVFRGSGCKSVDWIELAQDVVQLH
jgi:hypothetical protein